MSLVRATPASTGYVANISERAFTQGTFFCSEYRVVRERDGSIAGCMWLVHATPARTGYVTYTSERAFTQGNECMNERGIDLLPVCFCVRWIRRSHSFFLSNTFFFSNVCYSVFFQSEGKIRYRTRRIIAILFFFLIYRSASLYVMRYLYFFCFLSCRHSRSFVKECTELLYSCTYTDATHTKVHAISVLLFCKLYLLIILKLREPMHFFFGTTKQRFF
jgi:hypothetical protein